MWKKICDWIRDKWEWLKEKFQQLKNKIRTFLDWLKEKTEGLLSKVVKVVTRYVLPAAVGAVVIWKFPVVGAVVATVPVAKWIGDKLSNTPVVSAAIHAGLSICAFALFAVAPFIGLAMASYACIREWKGITDRFWTKFREALAKEQALLLKAQQKQQPEPVPVVAA